MIQNCKAIAAHNTTEFNSIKKLPDPLNEYSKQYYEIGG